MTGVQTCALPIWFEIINGCKSDISSGKGEASCTGLGDRGRLIDVSVFICFSITAEESNIAHSFL